jgi:hypothetical protein
LRAVVVDTGAWIALLSRTDRYAAAAVARYRELVAAGVLLVTNNYVVDETATRLRYDAGLEAALRFRVMLDDALRVRRLRISWVDERIEREGWRLMERHRDVTLSLTDAVTVALARRARIEEVFGFDDDFAALGLRVLPGAGRRSGGGGGRSGPRPHGLV